MKTVSMSQRVHVLLVFLLVCTLDALIGAEESGCNPNSEDASILMRFKNAVLDPSDHLSSWQLPISKCRNASSDSCTPNTHWMGITCGRLHGRVTQVELPSMSLSGTLPAAAIASLKFLRVLNLSSNSFHGSLPVQLVNCTDLLVLDLSSNVLLSGRVPNQWGRLRRLQLLWLYGNALSGPIPAALANCSELVFLELSYNMLSGSIPPELGALSKLQVLSLAVIPGLTGRIPASLANCSSLTELSLPISGLTGRIPPELGALKALQILKLFRNLLTGEIPMALGNCSRLSVLQVGENQLLGHIPQELGKLTGVTTLSLGQNLLRGAIPASLGNCSRLQRFALYNNYLTGSIPSQLGRLPLAVINLFSNSLSGEVPMAISNLTSTTGADGLEVMDLSFNQLGGTLQFLNEFTAQTSLFYLHLGGNLFRGHIPDVFDRFSALQVLGLNGLTATAPQPLPRSLHSLKSLAYLFLDKGTFRGSIADDLVTSLQMNELYLSSNNLSGRIPGSLGGLPGLTVLDVSHNSLSGEIPPELGSLFQLQYLNLSNNRLSGQVPATLTQCLQLISLNLSANRLHGPVPSFLSNMRNLSSLDLSYNNFTGAIPDQEPFNSTHTVTKLDGNPGLCGAIVHRQCSPAPADQSDINKRRTAKFSRIKFIAIALACLLLALALSILCFIQLNQRLHSRKDITPANMHLAGIHLINATVSELKDATGGFAAENILGTGGVSTVYRAVLAAGKAVAVKVIKDEMALSDEAAFRKEVAILAKLRHRNIVRVWGCCFNLELKAIILELMPNGSLEKHLYNESNNPEQQQLTGFQRLRILRGVAQGLEYLHHRHPDGPIVHCDLKPHNILLDSSFEACIADFGIAKVLRGSSSAESVSLVLRGSIGYIPPEYGYRRDISIKGDVYSYGVVMLEVLTCKSPSCVQAMEGEQTYISWIKENYFNEQSSNYPSVQDLSHETSSKLFELAMLCTRDSPFDRPTMVDICKLVTNLCNVEESKTHN